MAIYLKVEGLDQLKGKLKRMDRGTRNETLREGLKPGAEVVLAEAQRLAPVLSGELRDSLLIREYKTARVGVYSPLVYAPVIEFGWAAHGIEPQPYLRPALDENVRRVQRLFVDEMSEQLGLD